MNVSKMIVCDLKNGIIHNRRYLFVPVLMFFECMYSDNFLRMISVGREFGNPTIFDLFTIVFRGCDPVSKLPKENGLPNLPYFWIAVFIFAVFCGFDYMHDDLTQFGTQVITRCKRRHTWWNSKCIWCITSSLWFYLLTLLAINLYGALHGYEFVAENNYIITNTLAESSPIYKFSYAENISAFNRICFIIAPFMVICALNMLQMVICLFIKPIYSYIVPAVIIMFATYTDSPIVFTRCGMILYNRDYYADGYSTHTGIVICLIIVLVSFIIGGVYFKKANILPDKE